jgi:hydrogenase maturation protease
MGNPILSDDAVGIRLAGDFGRTRGAKAGFEVISECTAGGVDLLHVIEGYDRLVLVDSIQTEEGIPGNWCRFTAEALRGTIHLANLHDANFATVLRLGRQLGMRLPCDREIHIFAVEVLDNRTFSETMTGRLEEAYPIFSEEIFAELRGLLST